MKRVLIIFVLFIAVFGCKKKDPEPGIPEAPTVATLVFPYMNSLCNQGTNITATESTLLFEWAAGEFTDSYELKIEDLSDGSLTTYPTTSTQFSATLKRGIPYAWFVISISDLATETVQSETWRFYIAGETVQHYAPFPAEIISPTMASTVTAPVSLEWKGNDVDGDISGYDIYFSTSSPPSLLHSNVTDTVVTNVPVTVNTIYYWKVITIDSEGNSSDSGVYQFKVN